MVEGTNTLVEEVKEPGRVEEEGGLDIPVAKEDVAQPIVRPKIRLSLGEARWRAMRLMLLAVAYHHLDIGGTVLLSQQLVDPGHPHPHLMVLHSKVGERRWMEDEGGVELFHRAWGQHNGCIVRQVWGGQFQECTIMAAWAMGMVLLGPWQGGAWSEPWFHLANPKLRVECALGRPRAPEQHATGIQDSSLGAVMGGADCVPHRELRTHNVDQQGLKRQQGTQKLDSRDPGASAVNQVLFLHLGPWTRHMPWGPPPIQASFDCSSDQVALFLTQIISYLDVYGCCYPSQWVMVIAITAELMGEDTDWVADVHSDHTRELTDVGLFLEALWVRFEDESWAEGELVALRQSSCPAKEYIKEFRKIASRLRTWPDVFMYNSSIWAWTVIFNRCVSNEVYFPVWLNGSELQ